LWILKIKHAATWAITTYIIAVGGLLILLYTAKDTAQEGSVIITSEMLDENGVVKKEYEYLFEK